MKTVAIFGLLPGQARLVRAKCPGVRLAAYDKNRTTRVSTRHDAYVVTRFSDHGLWEHVTRAAGDRPVIFHRGGLTTLARVVRGLAKPRTTEGAG